MTKLRSNLGESCRNLTWDMFDPTMKLSMKIAYPSRGEVDMAHELAGKVAIITGGTSGIGLGTVELFVEEGAKVVVGDLQDDLGAELQQRFPDAVHYAHTDVTDDDQVEALVATAVERFGHLDIMFNNAGAGGDRSPILELGSAGLDKSLRLLTGAVVAGHRFAAAQFIKQGTAGSIISTASGASFEGGWANAGYTIGKHAVLGVIRQAAGELGAHGIRSNGIAPGIIVTPAMTGSFGLSREKMEEFRVFLTARLDEMQVLGRVGQPRDIAQAAVFLASDRSAWITGQTFPVDGGLLAVTHSTLYADIGDAARDFLAKEAEAQG